MDSSSHVAGTARTAANWRGRRPAAPLKYVVNTHHHFDHAGGLGAFAADGATIITHDVNEAFLEQSLAALAELQKAIGKSS